MPRGGLVFPMWAEIKRVDRDAMRNQPVGAGEAERYNDVFREPRLVDDGDGVGRIDRRESEPVQIRCQLESRNHESLRMLAAGSSPESTVTIVVHRRDAETAGLLDENGKPAFYHGDRLTALKRVSVRGTPARASSSAFVARPFFRRIRERLTTCGMSCRQRNSSRT